MQHENRNSSRATHRYWMMCDDLERARRNREIVEEGLYVEFWLWLGRQPRHKPLPQYPPADSTEVGT